MMNTIDQQHFAQVRRDVQTDLVEAIRRLEEVAASVDAANLFVAVTANISLAPGERLHEGAYGTVPAKLELLAYYLYPFFGRSSQPEIKPWHTQTCIQALEDLFAARSLLRTLPTDTENADPIARIVNMVRSNAEIVRGSAYPEQTTDEIVSVQGVFETWFTRQVGIGPARAQAILWAVHRSQQAAVDAFMPSVFQHARTTADTWQHARKTPSTGRSRAEQALLRTLPTKKDALAFGYIEGLDAIAPQALPVSHRQMVSLTSLPTVQEWEQLIEFVGLTQAHRRTMSDPVDVRMRPLFALPDGRVILIDVSNAMDALWDRYEQIAKSNERFFQTRYQRRKAKWLQERAYNLLLKAFPAEHVYHELTYTNPAQDAKGSAELDCAVAWPPFVVLVEAKAKQFRLESQLGDVGRLRTDIKQNVEDAFYQARRAARYIAETPSPVFSETSTGRKLAVDKATNRRIYLLTVSQHHLAGLATRLATLRDLRLFRDGEYPLSISVADLETVLTFCGGPDVFLHYVERRLDIQKMNTPMVVGDELDFFGAYLTTRLQPSTIWDGRRDKPDGVWLSMSDMFDQWVMYKRGQLSTPPAIGLKVPAEIHSVLTELRKREEDASRWIAFALLDMSDRTLAGIAQALRRLRQTSLTPGMLRRLVFAEGDTVVSVIGSNERTSVSLYQATLVRAALEKYRRKMTKSIGFGIVPIDTAKPFECAVWIESPWEHDEEIERALQEEPLFVPAPGEQVPSRNAPCPCGSGKKFKYCCLPKIKVARTQVPRGSQ